MRCDPGSEVSVRKGRPDFEDRGAVREAVRQAIEDLDLPPDFIRPGDHVVLKPNWVKESDERYRGTHYWEHMATNPLVIESVAEWLAPQLGRGGRVTICDGLQADSSFAKIRTYFRLDEMIARLKAAFPENDFQLPDLRPEEWTTVDGVVVDKTVSSGDPVGFADVSLNEHSFCRISSSRANVRGVV